MDTKTLNDYASLFFRYDFEKNDDIILTYFKRTEFLKNSKEFVKALEYCFFLKQKKGWGGRCWRIC